MCRHKPGRRCYRHSAERFGSAQGRYARSQEAFDSLPASTPPRLRAKAQARLDAAIRNLTRAQRDYYATRTAADAVRAQLASGKLPPEETERLERLLEASDALRAAQKVQVRAMPPMPPHDMPEAKALYEALGKEREHLAHLDAQLLVATAHGDTKALRHLAAQRPALEDAIYTREAACRRATHAGAADLDYLHPDERAALDAHPDTDLSRRIIWLSHVRATADRVTAHPARQSNTVPDVERAVLDLAAQHPDDPACQQLAAAIQARHNQTPRATTVTPTTPGVRVGDDGVVRYGWQPGRPWHPRTQDREEWVRQTVATATAASTWDGNDTTDADMPDPTGPTDPDDIDVPDSVHGTDTTRPSGKATTPPSASRPVRGRGGPVAGRPRRSGRRNAPLSSRLLASARKIIEPELRPGGALSLEPDPNSEALLTIDPVAWII